MLHCLSELFRGQSIQYILTPQPSSTSLQDSVSDLAHMGRVMSVGVDHDLHSMLLGHAQMNVIQIETVWIGVQLHRHFTLGSRAKHRIHIELVGVTPQQ
jgi:hypothetical protein